MAAMPKQYSMGGPRRRRRRAGTRRPARPAVAARALRRAAQPPPFLKLVWETNPWLTLGQCVLRVIRALLPVITLYVGKLIIDEVIALTRLPNPPGTLREWFDAGELNRIGMLLAVEFGLAVLSDVLGRAVSLLDSLQSEHLATRPSLRLMEHAATLDLEDFEDSELAGPPGARAPPAAGRMTLMGQLFSAGAGHGDDRELRRGLIVYAPWLIVLLAIALVPAFIGEAHFNAQSYTLNYARTPERRELDYVPQTAPSVESAKEVKIFGLNAFLIERYRALATSFFEANRRIAMRARRRRQRPDGDRHRRVLRRLCVHRLAHAARRVHDRRPHVPRRRRSGACARCSRTC
jgi:ATP-binding cassette subfamily B protein